jgi:diguanylate cyclase (GGDEF)-like protein/PAS domain S-box-containing protein
VTGAIRQSGDEAIRVLILEDNPLDVELLTAQLARDGLNMVQRVVSDEHEFRLQIAQFAPQLILSDFSLPRFDGLSALRIARAEAPTVPFIFVSGTIGEERAIEALKSGASDYVLKDNLRRLVPAIRAALRQYELSGARDLAEEMLRRSESRLQDIINTSADWIWESDGERRFTFSSPSVSEILGYTRSEILSTPADRYVEPADQNRLEAAFESLQAGADETRPLTLRWRNRAGETRWLERKMVALRGDDGEARGFRGIDRDVTMRVLQETRIERLNRALRFLSGTNSAIVRIRDRRDLLREACRLAVQIGEYAMATIYLSTPGGDDEQIVRRALSSKQSDARRPPREPLHGDGPVGRAMAAGEPVIVSDLGDASTHVPDRETLLAMGLKSCIALPLVVDGTPIGVALLHANETGVFGQAELALLKQVTSNITFSLQYLHSRESAEFLEYFDTLTQLANRSLYLQRLDATLKALQHDEERLVLLVFDISGLTMINDGLGHHTGDLVLQLVAERMKGVFIDSSRLCHLGGGRYAVSSTYPKDDAGALTMLRERVDFLFDRPFMIDDQELRVSIRAGSAQFPEDGGDAHALLHHAQTAVDHAKRAGEQYLRHRPDMNAAASERLTLTNRLHDAVARRGFTLNYQSKVCVLGRAVDGVEALLRWPNSGVTPDVFVPMLESGGLIDDIGRWVIDRALLESAGWSNGDNGRLSVAVNVSPLQLRRAAFADEILEILSARGAPASCLEIEVTESMLMANPHQAEATLCRLRDAGVTIAIDDFGTGHSSLQVLSRLPVDVLKIDRSFVRDLPSDRRHRLVVQTTIALAKSFGLKTVAEGVETQAQVDILADLGCDSMQGYLLHRPAPADELAGWLAAVPRRTANDARQSS